MHGVALFALVLFLIQTAEGTALYFSTGCAAFILIAAVAFNAAGGLTRASGAYVFFYSMLVLIVGISYKALLGEPAQSNLLDPKTDIKVYVGGITAMLAAVLVSRRLSRKQGLLQNVLTEDKMYRASVGCMVFGFAGGFLIALLGESAGRLASAFTQLNFLIPLGIIIGVMYEIRRSGGTRSVNLPILVGGAYYFGFYGILNFSKQGMLMPIVCWALPVCASRYRLSRIQVAGCCLGAFIIFHYLVPYSQYGRRFVEPGQTISQKMDLSIGLLEDPVELRKNYLSDPGTPAYYNEPQGFWDRLNFVPVDDKLINITDQGKVFGFSPLPAMALNAIPHVFWPNKPDFNFGNLYAHEIGGMPEEDTSTGISFSPTSEAYHMGKWVGIFVAAPLMWLLLFLETDSLFGDVRTSPWGLLVLAAISHTAPEGSLSGLFGFMSFETEAFIFCALFATWVAPMIADIVLGPNRRVAPAGIRFRPRFTSRSLGRPELDRSPQQAPSREG